MQVKKRDGTIVNFDISKITEAISGANQDVKGREKASIANKKEIAKYIQNINKDIISVEEIQDIVEKKLMELGKFELAKQYIIFREKKNLVRAINTTDDEIKELIGGNSDYWNNENSNKNAKVVTTQRDYLAGITSTDISRRLLLPKDVVKAHDEGIIHFHDMDYFGQNALHNCFSGDTKFITDLGVRSFNSFYDGASVMVKDKDGIWRKAVVRNYGKKKMYDVTIETPKTTKVITCTKDHRWILEDGTVTTNLKIGDKLYPIKNSASNYIPETLEELRAFCYGFILGDGCDYSSNEYGVKARLCNEKNEYLEYFIKAGFSYYKIKNSNDYEVYNKCEYSKQRFLDNCGWRLLSLEQKIALFHGYYSADGRKKSNSISTCDKRLMNMIEEISALAGYNITSSFVENRNTQYKNNFSIRTYCFMLSQRNNWLWTVKNIKPHFQKCNTPIEAWCVEEPITHTFMLENGVVTGNCELVNLEDMLQNGTMINGVMIEKPHRFITAATIATQIILAVTSSSYGGCTITLSHLAPFVKDSFEKYYQEYLDRGLDKEKAFNFARKDTKKEIEAGVQTFNYQVNSMTNTNGQAPFLSVCMYLGETEEYKEELAMIIEEFLKQRILGFKNEKGVYITPAFPKLLYVLEEDNIHKDSKYWYLTELAAKCTAKRMVPDYISEKIMLQLKKNQWGEGDCYPCMGCRSFLTPWTTKGDPAKSLNYVEGKGKYYGRFNQGVVTINLPDVALSSNGDEELFWKIFEERLELCHKALQCRHERLSKATSDVAPILWQHGALARLEKGESLEKLLHDGYSTISLGYAGLYECVKYMTGHSHTDNGEGKEFGLKVMQKLNDKCKEWKEAENIDYSVYGTPIESTTYKFAKCLKNRFGEIEGITDRDYITNSYHVPVFEEIDAFTKLKLESEFQQLSPGGAISYIETPNLQNNIEAVLQVIQFIYDNIMYAELNTKSDYCQVCGYDGEILIDDNMEWYCPNCGNRDHDKMNVCRRTCRIPRN